MRLQQRNPRAWASRFTALVAALILAVSPGALAEGPAITSFWKPWFLNMGGGTPMSEAPFLEVCGELKKNTTLSITCWGLDQPDSVFLVIGKWLEFVDGPGGSILVPFPEYITEVSVRVYDDDGPSGPKPAYSVLHYALPCGGKTLPGPGACFQVWTKTGQEWTASNAVAANFDLAEVLNP